MFDNKNNILRINWLKMISKLNNIVININNLDIKMILAN